MPELRIEIHAHAGAHLAFDLMQAEDLLSVGKELILGDGVALRYDGEYIRRSFGFPEILLFTATIAKPIAEGLIAAYIYDKLKERKKGIEKLKLCGHEVEVIAEEILRLEKAILNDGYEPIPSEYDFVRELE